MKQFHLKIDWREEDAQQIPLGKILGSPAKPMEVSTYYAYYA